MSKSKTQSPKTTSMAKIRVAFGGVSIGEATAKVSFAAERPGFTPEDAEQFLCGKRLMGRLVVTSVDVSVDQQQLPGIEVNHEIAATFDCKGYRATPKKITSGAVLNLDSINIESLGHFAKKSGFVIVESAEDAPTSEEESGEGDDHDDSLLQSEGVEIPTDGNWRKTPIGKIGLAAGDAKKLVSCDILTAGELLGRIERYGTTWHHETPGIGDVSRQRIEDGFNSFVMAREADNSETAVAAAGGNNG